MGNLNKQQLAALVIKELNHIDRYQTKSDCRQITRELVAECIKKGWVNLHVLRYRRGLPGGACYSLTDAGRNARSELQAKYAA